MSRLIDADKLVEKLSEVNNQIVRGCIGVVQLQPTAYDIEKEVAELEVLHDLVNVNQKLAVSQAIEIVRKGRKE